MHKDIIQIDEKFIKKPEGEIFLVYFSSISNNTHRFIQKLGFENARIPVNLEESLEVNRDYVIFCPTYSGGGNDSAGAVPKPVIKFLNKESNRKFCRGVIASGNTNFGDTFAIAGTILSKKLQVPLLYQFELIGTQTDVVNVQNIIKKFWNKNS